MSTYHGELSSPRSARSSTSSAPPPPLTPVYELYSSLDEMAIASSSGSSCADDDERDSASMSRISGSSASGSGSRISTAKPSLAPTPSPDLPVAGFSFGTCPSEPLNRTPTHELGPFDYPSSSSSTFHPASPRRGSLALGMTYRRGSIVARSPVEASSSTFPDPPTTRRSSTCSTITQLPSAGRRPSILHSASTNSGAIPPPQSGSTSTIHSPTHSRRSSLLFPQKQMSTPIPPSLLARRGSLPVSQFNAPSQAFKNPRASFAGHGQGHHYTTSTASLYRRRESVMSDGEGSQSSGQTITSLGTAPSRRGSVLPTSSDTPRRSSLTHAAETTPLSPGRTRNVDGTRMVNGRSRLSTSSMSSSETEEDEGESDEAEALPTPSTAGIFEGFTDPWADNKDKDSKESKVQIIHMDRSAEEIILGRDIA